MTQESETDWKTKERIDALAESPEVMELIGIATVTDRLKAIQVSTDIQAIHSTLTETALMLKEEGDVERWVTTMKYEKAINSILDHADKYCHDIPESTAIVDALYWYEAAIMGYAVERWVCGRAFAKVKKHFGEDWLILWLGANKIPEGTVMYFIKRGKQEIPQLKDHIGTFLRTR